MTTRLIGISGKPGSNKLFYAFRVMRELRFRGQMIKQVFLAKPLYEELNAIAKAVRSGASVETINELYELRPKGAELHWLLSQDIGDFHEDYGLSRRNEYVRKSLTMLGSSIR